MYSANQVYSCEYEIDGELFAMHICGTYEEALSHAENLGLGEPELVNAIVQAELNNWLN